MIESSVHIDITLLERGVECATMFEGVIRTSDEDKLDVIKLQAAELPYVIFD